MSTELSDDDVAMHLSSSPQIISAETILSASGGDAASSRAAAGAAGAAGGSCSVELGRRLLLAARAGDTGLVLELMTKGAPFSTDWLGTSPLHLAAANNHAETCGVLLRAGVSRDARTKVERTPLHLAAAAGHADVVRLLLDAGAAVHCRDMLRMTPLHWAAARGQLGAARLLLRHGADPRLRCKFRKTPRCLALRADRPDLVALLEEAEASDAVSERVIEEDPLKPEQEYKNIHKFEIKPQSKVKIQSDKRIIIESKTQPIPASAKVGRATGTPAAPAAPAPGSPAGAAGGGSAGGGGNASAAALLKAHGITLLPADKGSTVLTALRSGRTVVLSDAGKLMLKESTSNSNENQFTHATTQSNVVHGTGTANQSTSATITCTAGTFSVETLDVTGEGAPVQPARLPKGVKLVTLNKPQPVKRVIHPNDLQQVKVLRVPAAGKLPQSLPQSPGRRPAVKIVVDKAHLQRLLAASRPGAQTNAANNCAATDPLATDPIDITVDDDSQHAGGDSLRAQLTHAHAAIASLGAELRACRARLAHYEGADPQ